MALNEGVPDFSDKPGKYDGMFEPDRMAAIRKFFAPKPPASVEDKLDLVNRRLWLLARQGEAIADVLGRIEAALDVLAYPDRFEIDGSPRESSDG